jgi:hypothetical protein
MVDFECVESVHGREEAAMLESSDAPQQRADNELKDDWERVFGRPAPVRARRNFILRTLVYQKQADQYGGLSKATKRRLTKLYASFKADPDHRPPRARQQLKPGTRLVREWQGVVHSATVTELGFAYRNTHYNSLSAIAREITGTRWSGPTFFGLNGKHDRC